MKKKQKKKEIYGGMLYEFKPTIFSIIRIFLSKRLYQKTVLLKETIYEENATFKPSVDHLRDMPLQYIAIVSDEEVKELIRIDQNTAKLLLTKKNKLVPYDHTQVQVKKGMLYIDKQFIQKEINDQKD